MKVYIKLLTICILLIFSKFVYATCTPKEKLQLIKTGTTTEDINKICGINTSSKEEKKENGKIIIINNNNNTNNNTNNNATASNQSAYTVPQEKFFWEIGMRFLSGEGPDFTDLSDGSIYKSKIDTFSVNFFPVTFFPNSINVGNFGLGLEMINITSGKFPNYSSEWSIVSSMFSINFVLSELSNFYLVPYVGVGDASMTFYNNGMDNSRSLNCDILEGDGRTNSVGIKLFDNSIHKNGGGAVFDIRYQSYSAFDIKSSDICTKYGYYNNVYKNYESGKFSSFSTISFGLSYAW